MAEYCVVLFHSTAHALRAEKVLQQAGFALKMIPTPRQLSSDCGMALRFDRAETESVTVTLQENNVPVNGIHLIWDTDGCGVPSGMVGSAHIPVLSRSPHLARTRHCG